MAFHVISSYKESCPFCGGDYFVILGWPGDYKPKVEDWPEVWWYTPVWCLHLDGYTTEGKKYFLVFRDGAKYKKVEPKNREEISEEIQDRMTIMSRSSYAVYLRL